MAALAYLIAGLILVVGQAATLTDSPWFNVQDARGWTVLSCVAQSDPFKSGVLPCGGESRAVRDAEGRAISGFAYYGWTTGSSVRVIVLAAVPADQARPSSFPSDEAGTRYEQITSFTLAIGESRQVTELKAFGGEPTMVQITLRR
jgi:hypothetical protein